MKPVTFRDDNLSERARRNLAILEAIRRIGPISKSDISRLSGLNIVTISNYIDNYLRSKLVNIKALDVSAGGRRPALLEINAQACLAIGVGLNLHDMVGVVVDLKGNILEQVVRDRATFNSEDVIGYTEGIVAELLDRLSPENQKKLTGIGVGIAGIIDHQSGSIRWPQKQDNGGCEYISLYAPLKEVLEEKFGLPCVMENDATVACFGEQWISSDPQIQHLLYMFSGVGSGLILNGEIYRGATGCAGELALNDCASAEFLDLDSKEIRFLEAWEDDLGIVRNVRAILKRPDARHNPLSEQVKGDLQQLTLRQIFEAAQSGNTVAHNVIRRAGLQLGLKVAFLVNFLNPQVVVIGGGMEEGGSLLLNAVKESVSKHAYSEMANAAKIIPSRLGGKAVAVGAASLIVRHVLSQA